VEVAQGAAIYEGCGRKPRIAGRKKKTRTILRQEMEARKEKICGKGQEPGEKGKGWGKRWKGRERGRYGGSKNKDNSASQSKKKSFF